MKKETDKIKILLIDDDYINNAIISGALEDDYEVGSITDPKESIRAFSRFKPDLILLDLMMPDKDGYTVLSELKQVTNIPIVVVSCVKSSLDMAKAMKLRAFDFMIKPFDIDLFETIIDRIKKLKNFD